MRARPLALPPPSPLTRHSEAGGQSTWPDPFVHGWRLEGNGATHKSRKHVKRLRYILRHMLVEAHVSMFLCNMSRAIVLFSCYRILSCVCLVFSRQNTTTIRTIHKIHETEPSNGSGHSAWLGLTHRLTSTQFQHTFGDHRASQKGCCRSSNFKTTTPRINDTRPDPTPTAHT